MKQDLIQDTLYYNQRIDKANKAIESNSKAINLAYKNQNNLKEFQDLLSLHSFNSEHLTIQNDTYTEMTTSGNLNIIQNKELKVSIIRLYRNSEEAAKHVKEINEFTASLLSLTTNSAPIVKYYPWPWQSEIFSDHNMFNKSFWKFINEPNSYEFRLLENTLSIYI